MTPDTHITYEAERPDRSGYRSFCNCGWRSDPLFSDEHQAREASREHALGAAQPAA